MKSDLTKEKIIEETTKLIEESEDVSRITIRKIAGRADIGIGLINHYFGSKENLIEICVQNIINRVVYHQKISLDGNNFDEKERLRRIAVYVMDFLMENPQIARISILGDFENPHEMDNSEGTMYGFARCISKEEVKPEDLKKTFLLVALIQNAFLKRERVKQLFDVDFEDKKQRDEYVNSLVNTIM